MRTLKESILSSTASGKAGMTERIKNYDFTPDVVRFLEKQTAFYKVNNNKDIYNVIRVYLSVAGDKCSLNWIDTSDITDFTGIFTGSDFNGKIDKWDTSKATNMTGLFCCARRFNQDISGWDVSKVEDMSSMFAGAWSFNQDLSKWKVRPSCKMRHMFNNCPLKEEYKP